MRMCRRILKRQIGALGAFASLTAFQASEKAQLSLWRLDCGTIDVKDFTEEYSDRHIYPHGPKRLTESCYLIRHGPHIMLWDTGLPQELIGRRAESPVETMSLQRSLIDQLKTIGISPEQVGTIGISHYHSDHTGQARQFQNARLLIGEPDLRALKGSKGGMMAQSDLAHWLTGDGKVEGVVHDKDVFGDGTVVMIDLPGHTPGHHGLLVKLKSGAVLLSGDLYHVTEARKLRAVPAFNTSREQTLRSMARFEKLAKDVGAKVIIQHEPSDISLLPAFPEAAQ